MRELTHEQVVAEAAEWYDANYPGWYRKVDLGLLNMKQGDTCIAGQVIPAGEFKNGFQRLASFDSDLSAPPAVHEACVSCGGVGERITIVDSGALAYDVERLHDAWRDEIKRRFDEGAVS